LVVLGIVATMGQSAPAVDTLFAPSGIAGHVPKPQPPPPRTVWTIYKLAAKQTRVGEVEAATEAEANEKAAAEFKQYAAKLMAVRRT